MLKTLYKVMDDEEDILENGIEHDKLLIELLKAAGAMVEERAEKHNRRVTTSNNSNIREASDMSMRQMFRYATSTVLLLSSSQICADCTRADSRLGTSSYLRRFWTSHLLL